MTDVFKEREQSYEAKFKLDEEQRFKADARSNKILGLWAAERMGATGDKALAYAREVIAAEFSAANGAQTKVFKDLTAAGLTVTPQEIAQQHQLAKAQAEAELAAEYPEPLSNDHVRIGG